MDNKKIKVGLENNYLINSMISDIANVEEKDVNTVRENILLQTLLPQNEDAQFIVKNFLYNENGSIQRTMEAIFSNNAAGKDGKSVHSNLNSLVKYARTQENLCNTLIVDTENRIPHACLQVAEIIKELESLAITKEEKKSYYNRESEWAKQLLEELKDEPRYSKFINFYELVLKNWDDLKELSVTYRLLYDLVVIQKGWRNNADTRLELLQIIKDITSEWK